MAEKIIHLTTREERNIYMSPVRQELLRTSQGMASRHLAVPPVSSPSRIGYCFLRG